MTGNRGGTKIAGYDAASLYILSLLAPGTAKQVHKTFADLLDSPDGKRAQLLAISRYLKRVEIGDFRNLADKLHEHAHRILSVQQKFRSYPGRISRISAPPRLDLGPSRENEISRIALEGRRTDDGELCKLVVIHESGGTWALNPHGVRKFGVRLGDECAIAMAWAILADAEEGSRLPCCATFSSVSRVL
ncbi:MAG: hypothetical protein ACT4NY_07000 [Pseudonocardiales bacterium]